MRFPTEAERYLVDGANQIMQDEGLTLEDALLLINVAFPKTKVRCQAGIVAQLYSQKPCQAKTLLNRIPERDLKIQINGFQFYDGKFIIVV